MQFWEDMRSKWGFNDGGAIPAGIEDYRTVYIQAVNCLAEQLDSQVRAVAYNRPGLHNYCLILFYRVEDLKDVPVERYIDHVDIPAEVVGPEDAMQEAVWQAQEHRLDEWVLVSVEVDPGLDAFIADLKPVEEDGPMVLKVAGEPQHFYPSGQIEVVNAGWLKDHTISSEKNAFTIKHVYHYDGTLSIQDTDDTHHVVPGQWSRVIHIPEAYREHNTDQSPIPPYRVEVVERSDRYTPDVEADIADLYFHYDKAEAALKRAYERHSRCVGDCHGYGNTCLMLSDDDLPEDD